MLSPCRLALFSGAFDGPPDGSNQALGRLVTHLKARGWTVRIYGPPRDTRARSTSPERRLTRSLPIPGRPDYRLALSLSADDMADLGAFGPDIVHVASPDPLAWSAISAGHKLGAAIVASAHTRFETYLPYYGLSWLSPAARAYLAAFYRRCDCVLAPTSPMVAELSTFAPDAMVRLWSRGVDRKLFSPQRRSPAWRRAQGFGDEDVVVLFLGRLVREKGLGVLARSFEHARRVAPALRALIIGEGPHRGWLANRLPEAVFTGHLEGDALARAVASADLMFNPSRTEGFCNATLEAMASGLPIVGADVPAARAVSSAQAALFCPPTKVESFANALRRLAEDSTLRRAKGAAARIASARFDWESALDMAVAAYAETLTVVARRSRLEAAAWAAATMS